MTKLKCIQFLSIGNIYFGFEANAGINFALFIGEFETLFNLFIELRSRSTNASIDAL